MSNEKEAEPVTWDTLSREAKTLVYEHLHEAAARHRKEGAMAMIVGSVVHGRSSPVLEAASVVAASAFLCAIDELEASDPEICDSCGQYHDDVGPGIDPHEDKPS